MTERHNERPSETAATETPPNDKLSWPISRLGVPLSVEQCLSEVGIASVGDLRAWTRKRLLAIPGLGRKGLRAIEEFLGDLDLTLAKSGREKDANNRLVMAKPAARQAPTASSGSLVKKLEQPRRYPSEADRARAFAQVHAGQSKVKREKKGPRLNDPADRARIIELRNTVTMDVEDAAWLFGLARNTAYKAANKNHIPTQAFDDRLRVITQLVFDTLFPSPPEWMIGSESEGAEPDSEADGRVDEK